MENKEDSPILKAVKSLSWFFKLGNILAVIVPIIFAVGFVYVQLKG